MVIFMVITIYGNNTLCPKSSRTKFGAKFFFDNEWKNMNI